MNDGVWHELFEGAEEFVLLSRNVEFKEVDGFSCNLLPLGESFFDSLDGADARITVLLIYFSSVQIVNNHDLVTQIRESH